MRNPKNTYVVAFENAAVAIMDEQGELVETMPLTPGKHEVAYLAKSLEPGEELMYSNCRIVEGRVGTTKKVGTTGTETGANPDFKPQQGTKEGVALKGALERMSKRMTNMEKASRQFAKLAEQRQKLAEEDETPSIAERRKKVKAKEPEEEEIEVVDDDDTEKT